MSDLLRSSGKRKNHHKGIARAIKADKRAEAEKRTAIYQALPAKDKMARNSKKVWAKLQKTFI